ncbi:unnamed protein product [Dicrocoelium dendriticum]|nr:unnamed protein product [Dicrocoelium dendriticum]
MEVRRRNVTPKEPSEFTAKDLIQTLDAFPKLPQECKKSTTGGGLVTLLTGALSIILLISEIRNYVVPKYRYSYEVDKDFDSKVQINIDLVVATKCEYTSLDLLDVTGSQTDSDGNVHYRKATFQLTGTDRERFERRHDIMDLLRSQHLVVPEMLWKRDHLFSPLSLFGLLNGGGYEEKPGFRKRDRYDACHISGKVFVRKVAGNIHLVPGKAFTGAGGVHMHIAPLLALSAWRQIPPSVEPKWFNFSHRINHFSFGVHVANRVNPLDAIEQIAVSPMQTFQYHVSIVPTRIIYTFSQSDTYQYAVTMKNHSINHSEGKHGVPGIFITYETFPLRVQVTEWRELFGTFLARLAALVGGLFATVGFIRQAVCGIPEALLHTRVGRQWRARWIRFRRQRLAGQGTDTIIHETILDPG